MHHRTPYRQRLAGIRPLVLGLAPALVVALALFLTACGPREPVSPTMAQAEPEQRGDVPLIPMRDFFRNPAKTDFTISPDGRHIAFMQSWKRRLNVHVTPAQGGPVARVTNATVDDIAGYGWANNRRIVYLMDQGGNENYALFAVDADGGGHMALTPEEGVKARIVDVLEDDPEHMLVSTNERDKSVFDVYRVQVFTGERRMVAENPGDVSGWMTDNEGRLRLATTTNGLEQSILYRESEQEEFRTVLTTPFTDTVAPLAFTFDDEALWVSSNLERDKRAIYRFDPASGTRGELLYEHPEVDVSTLLRSKEREVVTGVAYYTEKRHYRFFDQQRAELQQQLEERLPNVEVVVTDMSKDERRVIVRTYTDVNMGGYYYFDRDAKDFRELAQVSPWLDPEQMASMRPIRYQARDGWTIHGYLTLPKGRSDGPMPVLVNPHGGPFGIRDRWSFNPEVQFLANRGIAVLQMNFRGSGGYGKDFWMAGFKQWGRDMQNDITDGVLWLIDQGIADPDKVAIYGASYGGYATLAGLTFTPDVYACGVDYVGPSNLFTLLESIPPYWEPYRKMMYRKIGHPEKDEELLRRVSPVFHARRIEAPLFVAQGANDPRVKKQESDQIVEALRERDIPVRYMVKRDEGHGFSKEENRFDFYRAMERFLAEHLGTRQEPLSPEEKKALADQQ
jgi:dipeptidyl aminopeptidase/acylaminoacyl peptidase